MFSIDSYEYDLPENLIAQSPHSPVDECRLMTVNKSSGDIDDSIFRESLLQLWSNDCLFFNNSKVLKARISLDDVVIMDKDKEKKIIWWELFYLWLNEGWWYKFMVKPWSKLKVWTLCYVWKYILRITWDWEYGRIISFDGDMYDLLSDHWQMPLPPYIAYSESKDELYQPVFAKQPGSVASPTASLHFTQSLLDSLKNNNVILDYITLHVWIGTFRSIKVNDVRDYDIHSEICEVDLTIFSRIASYKLLWKNIIAVWTTSCRTLESLIYVWSKLSDEQRGCLCEWKTKDFWDNLEKTILPENDYISSFVVGVNSIQFECKLFIMPWFHFTVVDQLITNFHLPKSSLMVLVASLLGYDYMMNAYRIAIQKNYMFYSFGDAMWIR